MDANLILHLFPVAVSLAGWVLFVLLIWRFRGDRTPHASYREPDAVNHLDTAEPVSAAIVPCAGKEETMSDSPTPTVTIRVAGRLFEGQLPYLGQLVQSATECRLWPVLDLVQLAEVDSASVRFLSRGEDRDFAIACCPGFVREWIQRDRIQNAA